MSDPQPFTAFVDEHREHGDLSTIADRLDVAQCSMSTLSNGLGATAEHAAVIADELDVGSVELLARWLAERRNLPNWPAFLEAAEVIHDDANL